MNDLRQFTTMRNITDNRDKLFTESAVLEQENQYLTQLRN